MSRLQHLKRGLFFIALGIAGGFLSFYLIKQLAHL